MNTWETILDDHLQGYVPHAEAERLALRLDIPPDQRAMVSDYLALTATLDQAFDLPQPLDKSDAIINALLTMPLPPLSADWGLTPDGDTLAAALLVGFLDGSITQDELQLVTGRLDLSQELLHEINDALALHEQLDAALQLAKPSQLAEAFLASLTGSSGSAALPEQAPVRQSLVFPRAADRDVLAASTDAGNVSNTPVDEASKDQERPTDQPRGSSTDSTDDT